MTSRRLLALLCAAVLGVLLVLVAVIGVLTLFVFAVAPVISDQIAQITRNAPGWLDDLQANKQVQKLDDQFDVIAKAQEYIQNGDFGQKWFAYARAQRPASTGLQFSPETLPDVAGLPFGVGQPRRRRAAIPPTASTPAPSSVTVVGSGVVVVLRTTSKVVTSPTASAP